MWHTADAVELILASKWDQFRKEALVTGSRRANPKGDSGQQLGAVELMIELMSYAPTLPRHAPLVAYQSLNDR